MVDDNCIANPTNLPVFDRLIADGYPSAKIRQQYRTLPDLSDILSDVFYRGEVLCMVDPSRRPNINTVRRT